MKLDAEFYRLPLRFDAGRLVQEVSQFAESDWRPHPQGHAGNSAVPLVSVGGDPAQDGVKGPMGPTPHLGRCPYLCQVLASFRSVLGRTRLMRIAGNGEATAHVDTNYYWMQHFRVHVPVITFPEVRFLCGAASVNMAAGECWVFDTWRRHNVLNPNPGARIHLVADVVGSSYFWDLLNRGERPPVSGAPAVPLQYTTGQMPDLVTERSNFPVVMSPWEQETLFAGFLEDLGQGGLAPDEIWPFQELLLRFQHDWRDLWAGHATASTGWPAYRRLLDRLDGELRPFEGLALPNGVTAAEAVRQGVVRSALNPDLAEERTPSITSGRGSESHTKDTSSGHRPAPPDSGPVAQSSADLFDRPVFIVAAPRSGSTLLFETLARSPDFVTIGGESHEVFERVPRLDPAQRGFDSNRLTDADANPETNAALKRGFLGLMRDREGRAPAPGSRFRLLEKTPKNALRLSFLNAIFPDALFIYLYREPRDNLSSILDAWRSGRFITYPQLPDWDGPPWSLLLIPEWRRLCGRPLAEIAAAQWEAAHRHILDDLDRLAQNRWVGVSYADLLADPQTVAERLCRFAGVAWDQQLKGPLPLSRHTLTPPDPNKWRHNAEELKTVLPNVRETDERARRAVGGPDSKGASAGGPGGFPPPALPKSAGTTPVAHPGGGGVDSATGRGSRAEPVGGPPSVNGPPHPVDEPLRSIHTSNFPQLLDQLGVSLLISTYQAGKLIVVRSQEGKLNTHFRTFEAPMGMAISPGRLAVATARHVWEFRNQPALCSKLQPPGRHDACYLNRVRYQTGDIRVHEIAYCGDELWVVNTRFSCLCTLDGVHSFVPRWRPPFVTALSPEDRCHLNGLAVIDGRPKYVTCLGRSDVAAGWRPTKANGGCLVDVDTGEAVLEGLSMPHSPRWYGGKLWLLESGLGGLARVELATGQREQVAELPGFTRGLDFHGPLAFIGLSQVRESNVFGGLAITQRLTEVERACGVWVVDLTSGRVIAFLRFEAGVQEVFAVQVLPNARHPEILPEDDPLLADSFVLPEEALASVVLGGAPRV